MTEDQPQQNQVGIDLTTLPPIKLAFIIDGEVVDILHTDERLSAILTSNPLILDVTERMTQEDLGIGYSYDQENNKFTRPGITE